MHRFTKVLTAFRSRFHRNMSHLASLKSISNTSMIVGGGSVLLGVSAGCFYIIEAQSLAMEKLPFNLAHPDVNYCLFCCNYMLI